MPIYATIFYNEILLNSYDNLKDMYTIMNVKFVNKLEYISKYVYYLNELRLI